MAKEKIVLGINLRKNKIETSTGYGKYYPEVDVEDHHSWVKAQSHSEQKLTFSNTKD